MGWFDGETDYRGDSSSHRRKTSPKRQSSGGAGNIFGIGDARHNSSRSSFFGIPNRSTSSYKRSPRTNYLKRMYAKLRRLLRDLLYYLKKHPMKVFMLVIMPLITGGALTGLLARFGIRLPGGIEKLFGGMAGGMGGGRPSGFGSGGYGGGRMGGGGGFGGSGGLGGLGNMAAAVGGVGGAMNIAKMFL